MERGPLAAHQGLSGTPRPMLADTPHRQGRRHGLGHGPGDHSTHARAASRTRPRRAYEASARRRGGRYPQENLGIRDSRARRVERCRFVGVSPKDSSDPSVNSVWRLPRPARTARHRPDGAEARTPHSKLVELLGPPRRSRIAPVPRPPRPSPLTAISPRPPRRRPRGHPRGRHAAIPAAATRPSQRPPCGRPSGRHAGVRRASQQSVGADGGEHGSDHAQVRHWNEPPQLNADVGRSSALLRRLIHREFRLSEHHLSNRRSVRLGKLNLVFTAGIDLDDVPECSRLKSFRLKPISEEPNSHIRFWHDNYLV